MRLVALVVSLLLSTAAMAVQVGDRAPEFALVGSDGNTWRLSELRGRFVAVAFFPKAFTGG